MCPADPDTGKYFLQQPSVRRVQAALTSAGAKHPVRALWGTARSAQDAAQSIGCPLGAIVKSLVFAADGEAVMALIAGDRQCDTAALARALALPGQTKRADADLVRRATGFAIGGVAPLAHATRIPIAVDASLARFDAIHAAAGHPHCVFQTDIGELARLTGGKIDDGIARAD